MALNMKLEGGRIYLREINIMDTQDILRWRNREDVRSFFINRDLFTVESHTAWLNNVVGTGKAAQFIMVDKAGEYPFGSVYLRDIDHGNKKAEFGIFIGEDDYLGAGYGTEAVRLIIQYGFEELKLNKIYLRVLTDNIRALKSYEKAGFAQEGYFKQEYLLDGEYKDIIFMAILRENYLKQQGCQ